MARRRENNAMEKNKVRGYVAIGVLLVLITVIAFAVPFSKTATFWIGYIFALIAIGVQVYFFKGSLAKADVKSRFYGFPIARIGVIYLCVQVAFSLVEMIVAGILAAWIAIVINIVFLGVAVLGCVAAETMKEEIEKQDVTLKANVENMRGLQSLASSIVGLTQDEDLKKVLADLADDFKYSDPVSSDVTLEIETELKFMVGEIQRAIIDGDTKAANGFCVRAKASLAERNRICKLHK